MEVKRKPGRPKKEKIRDLDFEYKGIIDRDDDPETIVRIHYNKPMNLRSILELFKEYVCQDVLFVFKKQELNIFGTDRTKRILIKVSLNGADMNTYYAREKTISVKLDNLIVCSNAIDKNHDSISIIIKSPSILILELSSHGVTDHFDIHMTSNVADEPKIDIKDLNEYALSFSIESQFLRKRISTMSKISTDSAIISKEPNGPLSISFGLKTRVHYECRFENDTVKENIQDLIAVPIDLEYIKPIPMVSYDRLTIFIDHKSPIVFQIDQDTRTNLKIHYAMETLIIINSFT